MSAASIYVKFELRLVNDYYFVDEWLGYSHKCQWGPFIKKEDADAIINDRRDKVSFAIQATAPYQYVPVQVTNAISVSY